MGYRLRAAPVTLVIDEGEYEGVEAECDLNVSPGTYFAVRRLMDIAPGETADDARKRLEELFQLVADRILLSWNVEDRAGNPVGTDAASLADVPPELIGELLGAFIAAERTPSPLRAASPKARKPTSTGTGRTAGSRRRR